MNEIYEKYDLIIKNKTIIHKNNFTEEKFKSHFFEHQIDNILFKCKNCGIMVYMHDYINSGLNVLIMDCYIVGGMGCYIVGGIVKLTNVNYMNTYSKDTQHNEYNLSCDEVIIKNIIE